MDELAFRMTDKKCRVCGGQIIERSRIPYIPALSKDLTGLGARNIATEKDRKIDGYHCQKCGIEYHKLPESGRKKIKEKIGKRKWKQMLKYTEGMGH